MSFVASEPSDSESWVTTSTRTSSPVQSEEDGTSQAPPRAPLPVEGYSGCEHYVCRVQVYAPCCGVLTGCRLCHDAAVNHAHQMDRTKVKKIRCGHCDVDQEPSNKCTKCEITFAEYFCDHCKLWAALDKRITANGDEDKWHCDGCGICRVGGRSKFTHCTDCGFCQPKQGHSCSRKCKKGDECGICLESLHDSRLNCQTLPCGHMFHTPCMSKQLARDHLYRCPLCRKTALDKSPLEAFVKAMDDAVRDTPIPEECAKEVKVGCADCEMTTTASFHFVGIKCGNCGGYNTQMV